MKNIFIVLFSILLIACGTTNTLKDVTYGRSMYNLFEQEYTVVQFDSICNADNISNDLSKWKLLQLRNGEDRTCLSEYMYIKSLGNEECIYRLVTKSNGKYKITKRITK